MTKIKYFTTILLLSFCIIASAQQYGTDNILNFYTVEDPIYIPYGQKVIYQDFNTRTEIDVDSASFVSPIYLRGFAFDKNGVYYKGKIVDADTTGFRYLTDRYRRDEIVHIWKNSKHVYFGDSLLANIDAATCKGFLNDLLRDKNGQYEDFKKITNKQKNKKLLLEYPKGSEGFSREYAAMFIPAGYMINAEGIDKESFEVLGPYYAKDKNGVYCYDESTRKPKKLEGALKDSFKDISFLNEYLAYDKYFVYLKDKRLDQIISYDLQVLGVYMGYRANSEFDFSLVYDYILIKNAHGYWMISEHKVYNLGRQYPDYIINRSQQGKRKLMYM